MSWNDFYRRRAVMDAILEQAAQDPAAALPFARTTGAEELFGTEENLLLALRYRWDQLLGGYLRAELADPEGAMAGEQCDQVDAVSRAWHRATTEHGTLRAVLEAHRDAHPLLASAHQAEQRMLAVTAGLADADESPAEVAKVGVAFDALLRHSPARPARRRGPVSHLMRLLAPSA